ncbi:MAG: N,N'-diacetylbacillosaminyl-diphospho-undecaprenol alpha-1,3-N-acetylgalactosaminyltransferase [Anaerolineales bacterium]|nr:N,N'-diacetylbacillosaminyl-diphospho-undecaprenol alpha-1,3-N-acetylgalactosaminyltransferase [Anaerolineales bacterium]
MLSRVLLVGGPDVDARIELMRRLMDFKLLAAGTSRRLVGTFSMAGLEFHYYPMTRGLNPIRDLYSFLSLTVLFLRLKPHIVHTYDTKPAVFARIAARLARVPIVIGTLPGLGSLYSGNDPKSAWIRRIYEPLQKLSCHLSDLTIFQNPEDTELFIQKRIVPRQKTATLPGSGVDVKQFDPRRSDYRERKTLRANLGLDDFSIIVIMISRLLRSKGVLEFADVARSIKDAHPDIAFLLAGQDDPESMDALTETEKEHLQRSVTWLGPRNDIPQLLALSDIFTLPTYYREGIPRVLLEAASMGLPIVTTQSPGCMEVVEQNMNGFLTPARDENALKDAILKLALDPSLRRRMGETSRQRAVARFDLSIIAQQTASIYRHLLARKGYGNPAHP